jgi:hypothetical protein
MPVVSSQFSLFAKPLPYTTLGMVSLEALAHALPAPETKGSADSLAVLAE